MSPSCTHSTAREARSCPRCGGDGVVLIGLVRLAHTPSYPTLPRKRRERAIANALAMRYP